MKSLPLIKPSITPILLAASVLPASALVTIDYVSIGNPGNTADPSTGFGAVSYAYQIGKYEVTNAQYGEFLNTKGASNSGGIYNDSMASRGITQVSGPSGFTYNVTAALANRPVVHVSWFDAARFANWMMNGQGSGDMENGAYTLNGATSGIITANIGAAVYIPTEDEWYKAAYYIAANTSYSLYPNGQNTISTADANYGNIVRTTTNVGSYTGDPSAYGTFDQGGNVSEWNDAVISGFFRGLRGGSWVFPQFVLGSPFLGNGDPTVENADIGFRVASVPEPTSLFLALYSSSVILFRRKR